MSREKSLSTNNCKKLLIDKVCLCVCTRVCCLYTVVAVQSFYTVCTESWLE